MQDNVYVRGILGEKFSRITGSPAMAVKALVLILDIYLFLAEAKQMADLNKRNSYYASGVSKKDNPVTQDLRWRSGRPSLFFHRARMQLSLCSA